MDYACDLTIIGGGIAGLWLTARLKAAGFQVLLLDQQLLGGVQTSASQGILHGGIKYTLQGRYTGAAQAIAAMPARWMRCLEGTGELDLQPVSLLADSQWLWSTETLSSRLSTFFASRLLADKVQPVAQQDRPDYFHGSLYQLREPVLAVDQLIQQLVHLIDGQCLQIVGLQHTDAGLQLQLADQQQLHLHTQAVFLTAGAGNAQLLQSFGYQKPKMQLRPLQMVLVRGALPRFYGHCLGPSSLPLLTVTSHQDQQGRMLWYLGGQLAEEGVKRDPEEQIAAARSLLPRLCPWLDLNATEWAVWPVARAEADDGGQRPDTCSVQQVANWLTVIWPTKLAFAPLIADQVLSQLQTAGIQPGQAVTELPANLTRPALMPMPWEQAQWS